MSPAGELTTTRPMNNADRQTIWKAKRTSSPPGGQPRQVPFFVSVLADLPWLALLAVTLAAFLAVLKWTMDAA